MTNYIGNHFTLTDQGEVASIPALKLVVELFWNVQSECLKNIQKEKPGLCQTAPVCVLSQVLVQYW